MKNTRWFGIVILGFALLLGGCASPNSRSGDSPVYRQGVVDRIEVLRKGDTNNIAGTVLGGIAGGLLGHQVGGGSGQTAATILGSVGGAVAGNQVQKNARGSNETFRVTVRYDNGATETIHQDDINEMRVGDKVRIDHGRVYRM
jgi:outer membrane lipoprotein SlyB